MNLTNFMSNLLSYNYILNDRSMFQNAGTKFGDDFNLFDTPSHKYFKILFYFGSESEDWEADRSSGLLSPTWEIVNAISKTSDTDSSENSDSVLNVNYYEFNSAWAFLKLNDENERAEKLEQFVTLLSDISSKSPWYFTSISGIQDALERKYTEEGKLEMSERKKLTISCLPDAFDNRIGTLLELYRDVTWSWVHKKEIIPANLRKFDMAIYIFEAPEHNWNKDSVIGSSEPEQFKIGYKMIEFHDCEFNYNSVKSAWSTIDNQTGMTPTYQIDISYDDCYEISYNDIMMRTIGDVILTDLVNASENKSDYISNPQVDNRALLDAKINDNEVSDFTFLTKKPGDTLSNTNVVTRFGNLSTRHGKQSDSIDIDYKVEYEPGFIGNAVGQIAGHLVDDVRSKINRAILGNLYTYSLTQFRDQVKDFLGGNLIKTGMSINEYVKEAKARKDANNKQKPNGDIFPEPEPRVPLTPRNLYSHSTIANNL